MTRSVKDSTEEINQAKNQYQKLVLHGKIKKTDTERSDIVEKRSEFSRPEKSSI